MDAFPQESANKREVGYGKPPVEHQFKPGNNANPNGRPKGRSLTALIREVLDKREIGGTRLPEGRTVADVLAEVMVKEALKGKFPFAKEVLDRTDGKVPEKVEANVTTTGTTEQALEAVFRVLGSFPDARVAVARELMNQSNGPSEVAGDAARPGLADAGAGSDAGPVAG